MYNSQHEITSTVSLCSVYQLCTDINIYKKYSKICKKGIRGLHPKFVESKMMFANRIDPSLDVPFKHKNRNKNQQIPFQILSASFSSRVSIAEGVVIPSTSQNYSHSCTTFSAVFFYFEIADRRTLMIITAGILFTLHNRRFCSLRCLYSRWSDSCRNEVQICHEFWRQLLTF